MWPLRVVSVLLTQSHVEHIHPGLALRLLKLPHIVVPQEFCAPGTSQTQHTNGGKGKQETEVDTRITHVSSAHTEAPLSCQATHKTQLSDKVTKNLKMVTIEPETKWGGPSEDTALCDCAGYVLMKDPCPHPSGCGRDTKPTLDNSILLFYCRLSSTVQLSSTVPDSSLLAPGSFPFL